MNFNNRLLNNLYFGILEDFQWIWVYVSFKYSVSDMTNKVLSLNDYRVGLFKNSAIIFISSYTEKKNHS